MARVMEAAAAGPFPLPAKSGSSSAFGTTMKKVPPPVPPRTRHPPKPPVADENASEDQSNCTIDCILSDEERKRQGALAELVHTEQTFVNRLIVTYEVFYIGSQAFLSNDERAVLFSNLESLLLTNGQFLQDLLDRQKSDNGLMNSIADIYLKHAPNFDVYVPYCVGHGTATRLLQEKLENAYFSKFVKGCLRDPACAGLDLGSFLLEPVQRLARYPLLLKQILHYTEKSHKDHALLVNAVRISEEHLQKVNEAVRSSEAREKVLFLQSRLVYHPDQTEEKIALLGMTRCLGERQLLHEGTLLKHKSRRKLATFLFNDILLFTEFNGLTYQLYRKPFSLDEVAVNEFKNDPNLQDCFEIVQKGNGMFLTAEVKADKNQWVAEINEAIERFKASMQGSRRVSLSISQCIGTLRVSIIAANGLYTQPNLTGGGIGGSSSTAHPFCVVQLNSQRVETSVAQGVNPFWNQSFVLSMVSRDEILHLSVLNYYKYAPHGFMGKFDLALDFLEYYSGKPTENMQLTLVDVPRGQLIIQLHYRDFE